MTETFLRALEQSGYLHKRLPCDPRLSAEARQLQKQVTAARPLWDGASPGRWEKSGGGALAVTPEGLRISAPARAEFDAPMPHYTGFGCATASLRFAGDDWRGFNRVRCRVRPACDGFHAPFLTLGLVNEGERPIPDAYGREGAHVVNLRNHAWNDCVWEFPDLPRDRVTAFTVNLHCHGRETGGADDFIFYVKDVTLEQAEPPDVSLGWRCAAHTLCYATSGYYADGQKHAVTAETDGAFALVDADDGRVVYTAPLRRLENEKGVFGLADFSDFTTAGRYRLRVGDTTTEAFPLSANPFDEAAWKALHFIFAERCGYPVAGGHGFCHTDIAGEHKGRTMAYCGGWHDAGDLSQQTLQTAETAHALFELAARADDPALRRRLTEEARWGLDFVLRTRFGDGHRITSVGLTRWTDLLNNSPDDEKARAHNRSFENFLMGGVAAYAALALREEDPEAAFIALKAAREDYRFAAERFAQVGPEPGVNMEHSYNAGRSQYYAAASWCASQLYAVGGEARYASDAARYGESLLACQDTGDAGLPFSGFFYRDETRRTLTHFNHQSREHLYAMALVALCETQKNAPALSRWEESLRRYAGYIRAMSGYAAPYGMQPAGVHAYDEADDADTFPFLHLMTTFEAERDNYRQQLAAGLQLNERFCLRQFPVWFSFRGNAAVTLSAGKAASLLGRYFGDRALTEIARAQLYWHAGLNPFGQSLMYGEGCNFAQQYAALLGETVGEMPVGVQTRGNEDVPYWPMANNATYKEVWVSTAAHWLRVVADMY